MDKNTETNGISITLPLLKSTRWRNVRRSDWGYVDLVVKPMMCSALENGQVSSRLVSADLDPERTYNQGDDLITLLDGQDGETAPHRETLKRKKAL